MMRAAIIMMVLMMMVTVVVMTGSWMQDLAIRSTECMQIGRQSNDCIRIIR